MLSIYFALLLISQHFLPAHPIPLPDDPDSDATLVAQIESDSANDTTSSLKEQLELLVGPILKEGSGRRFIFSEGMAISSIGSDDPAASNKELSAAVDVTLTKDFKVSRSRRSYVDLYTRFLIQAGTRQTSSKEETEQSDRYYQVLAALAILDQKLDTAYKKDQNVEEDPLKSTPDEVSMEEKESWALQLMQSTGGRGSQDFTRKDYDRYQKLSDELLMIKPQFEHLDQSLKVAGKGYMLQEYLRSYPGVFNLSMVVGGKLESPQAEFAPAFYASLVNQSVLPPEVVEELSDNLEDALGNSTHQGGPIGNSINSEAPVSTSSLVSEASIAEAFTTSASSSTSTARITTTANSGSSTGSDDLESSTSASTSTNSSSSSNPSSDTSSATPTSTDNPERRSLRTSLEVHSPPPSRRAQLFRRSVLTDAFASAVEESKPALSSGSGSHKFSVKLATANANDSAAESDDSDGPFGGAGDQQIGALIVLEIRQGAWGNDMDESIGFAHMVNETLVKSYYGDAEGFGPLRHYCAYVVLAMLSKPNTKELGAVKLIGTVWQELIMIKNLPWMLSME